MMLIAELISILSILLSCHEYHHTTAQAQLTNLDNNTELNSQVNREAIWIGNTKSLNTRTEPEVKIKHKRALFQRSVSSVTSSENRSSSRNGTNLKNKSDSSQKLSEKNNKGKDIRPSISKNPKSPPGYVITGIKVTETYNPPLLKSQRIRKNRYLYEAANSSDPTFAMDQVNTTDFNLSANSKYSSVRNVINGGKSTDDPKNQEVTSTITTLEYGTNKNISSQHHSSNGSSNIYEIPNSVIVFELEPVSVSYSSKCDRLDPTTCWFERDIGDTLTLGINITSFKEDNSVNVRWVKVYKRRNRKKGFIVKIDPGRLPWNMVWQHGGRELQLSPVTNSDVDPNAIAARVFQAASNSKHGKLYRKIRQLDFRIDIRSIDVVEVYPGKDITIHLDDFLTLPKSRRFWMDWHLEKFPGLRNPLPFNFEVSSNQKSLVIKGPEDRQLGVVACVVYSSKGLAFAKRKFNILKMEGRPTPRSKKRSLSKHHRKAVAIRHRNPFLRCLGRGDATYSMPEYMKPISRKKRYQRIKKFLESRPFKRDCRNKGKHRRRLHPRWAFFDEYEDEESTTTLDPRVMSVRELIELSDDSDGTIDDVIPREVHYVDPDIILMSDMFLPFPKSPNFQPNCTTDEDCGQGALCVVPQGQKRRNVTREASKHRHRGYCYCRPEYYGDGFQCTKLPSDLHRGKRIRRKTDAFLHIHHFLTSLIPPVRESRGNRSK